MNFSDALALLKAGTQIQRVDWRLTTNASLILLNGTIYVMSQGYDNTQYVPTQADILANDWCQFGV